MKAGKEHRVPLSDAALALLGPRRSDDALVFESEAKPGKPISDISMTAVLRRMGRNEITVHDRIGRSAKGYWRDEQIVQKSAYMLFRRVFSGEIPADMMADYAAAMRKHNYIISEARKVLKKDRETYG